MCQIDPWRQDCGPADLNAPVSSIFSEWHRRCRRARWDQGGRMPCAGACAPRHITPKPPRTWQNQAAQLQETAVGRRKEMLTFRIDTLRVRPLSLVGLMLSAFFDRFLVFLGGLVPRPVVEELELEVLVLKRERPRTMAGEGLGGSPRRGGRAENYAEAPMSRLARWTPRASAVVGRRRGARRLPAPVARGE